MKILVLFPTATEASLFKRDDVVSIVSGVGLTATAYASHKAIVRHQPDLLILAGIAGVFPHSGYRIGDSMIIGDELEADLGFFTAGGFVHLAELPIDMAFERRHTLHCPYAGLVRDFPLARGISVNAGMAPFIDSSSFDIENMEGAALFHVCQQERQAFLELRTVSNIVSTTDDQWDMQGSVSAMTAALHQLIDDCLARSDELKAAFRQIQQHYLTDREAEL